MLAGGAHGMLGSTLNEPPMENATLHGTEPLTPPSARSFARNVVDLAFDIRDLASDHLELAVLEVQRASIGLAKFLCAAVVVSILVITAWLTMVTGGIVWATDHGVGWVPALFIAALLNLVAAAGIVFWVRARKGELLFAATLRQMRRTADVAEEAL